VGVRGPSRLATQEQSLLRPKGAYANSATILGGRAGNRTQSHHRERRLLTRRTHMTMTDGCSCPTLLVMNLSRPDALERR